MRILNASVQISHPLTSVSLLCFKEVTFFENGVFGEEDRID